MILTTFDEYLKEGPFIPLLISCFSLVAIVFQCFNKHQFLKIKLIINLLLTIACGLSLAFYNEFLNSSFNNFISYVFLGFDIIGIILLFSTVNLSLSGENIKNQLINSLNQTKNYFVLDKKDRIQDISKSLLDMLNLESYEVIGKNCFEVLEMSYLIIGFNGSECRKKDIIKYYDHYQNKVKSNTHETIEIALQEDNGKEFILTFLETPIFQNDKYKGRILIGDRKDSSTLSGIEKENENLNVEIELLKSRFSTLLLKSEDGIYFNNQSTNTIWFNQIVVDKLNLENNEIKSSEYYKNIHPEDIVLYNEKINKLDDNDEYSISYRYNIGGAYLYIKEEGCKIVVNDTVELCGVIKVIDDESFATTKTMLDMLSSTTMMNQKFFELLKQDRLFQVVYIRIDNIPDINEKYSRSIGNALMSHYIDFFKNHFVTDNLIYRVTGLEFVAFITTPNKMENLKNTFKEADKFLHPTLQYTNGKIVAEVYMGVTYSNDTPNRKDLIKLAKEAMLVAKSPKFSSNYAYYREIR